MGAGVNLSILDMIQEGESVKSNDRYSTGPSKSNEMDFNPTIDEPSQRVEIVMPPSMGMDEEEGNFYGEGEMYDRYMPEYNTSRQMDEHDYSSEEEEGSVMPPIRFSSDDGDSVSQITSSIASHSFYDQGALYPSTMRGKGILKKSAPIQKPRGSDLSVSDTLDEIANILGPESRGHPGRASSRASTKSSSKGSASRTSSYSEDKSQDSWRSVRSNLDSSMSKCRLVMRYIESRFFPNYRRKVFKEEEEEEEEDYFGMLMSSTPTETKRSSSSRRQDKSVTRAVSRLFSLFMCTTTLFLLVRLSTMPTEKTGRRMEPVSGYGEQGDPSSQFVRGGMAHYDRLEMQQQEQQQFEIQPTSDWQTRNHPGQSIAPRPVPRPVAKPIDNKHEGIALPEAFDDFADLRGSSFRKRKDMPFFWHIPRVGGATMNDILGGCLSLTLASDAGGAGHEMETELRVRKLGKGVSYLNVNTATKEGISRAAKLGLASSGKADVVLSTLLYPSSQMFSEDHKARMFTIFRHPIERAVSLFHFVQDTQWRRQKTFKKDLSSITIEEYFKNGMGENNWMTRFLSNQLTKGKLTEKDLQVAKEVLRRKCLIGLLSEKGESFARFEKYFGWSPKSDADKECHEKKLQWAWPLKHRHDEVEEGSELWNLIMESHKFDMKLYEYAQVLFHEQRALFQ